MDFSYPHEAERFGKEYGADMDETVELARGAVLYGSWAADPAQRHLAALRVKAFAGRLAGVRDRAVQVFGGLGYTGEHDAHPYLRRLLSFSRFLGGPDSHLEQVGRALVGRHA